MKKRILILGVGNAQVDAIAHCRDLGHRVYGISHRDEGRGRALVDDYQVVDIIDKDAVLRHAERISADLVYSVGSDVAMPTVSYVSQRLNLPHYLDEDTALILQNKGALRERMSEAGPGGVPFCRARGSNDLEHWTTFPAMIKPADSQGQRGIFRANDADDLMRFFPRSLSFSRCGEVVVEQFIDGPEISVNAFLRGGRLEHAFITDRLVVSDLPGGIVRGHRIPATLEPRVEKQALVLAEHVARQLALENGPLYFQMKYTDEDVFLIEAAPRLDGCHLWRLIRLKYGTDLLALTFDGLLRPARLAATPAKDLVAGKTMQLDFSLLAPDTRCQRETTATNTPLYSEWYYEKGEMVRPINGYAEKVGYRIALQQS